MPPSLVDGGRWRPGAAAVAVAFAVCLMTLLLGAPRARAASAPDVGAEAAFVGQVNDIRADRSLPTLLVDEELTGIARGWAAEMADGRGLSHNPDLERQVNAAWSWLSENVGYGVDVGRIMADFEKSASHVGHMVDSRMSRIGVGVVRDDRGYYWTAHVFMGIRPRSEAPVAQTRTTNRQPARTRAPVRTAATETPETSAGPISPVELTPPTTDPPATLGRVPEPLPDNLALSVASAPAKGGSSGSTQLALIFFTVVSAPIVLAMVIRTRRAIGKRTP